jgi:hypothetical protein
MKQAMRCPKRFARPSDSGVAAALVPQEGDARSHGAEDRCDRGHGEPAVLDAAGQREAGQADRGDAQRGARQVERVVGHVLRAVIA